MSGWDAVLAGLAATATVTVWAARWSGRNLPRPPTDRGLPRPPTDRGLPRPLTDRGLPRPLTAGDNPARSRQ